MINLKSEVQNKILDYFFLNEARDVYINELARIIDADPKNLYRMLLRLESEGVLESEFKGKQRYFRARKKSPVYAAYKTLYTQTAGLGQQLKKELSGIKGLREGYLFGSYGTKKFGPESDIDLLLVGDYVRLQVQRVLFKIQKKIAREINAVHLTDSDFRKQKIQKGSFVHRVLSANPTRIV
ncbi:MAG: hypothetical protein A3C47_01020 [Omnitrophica bacterium RIFCSPHIGHO2_02_FULL_51_18]|nr:MAG: hypothetical protein A3C47_01020 [Omnitrophica bacterium RIFCSPHIGHO2_02_FULL_51_18]